MQRSLLVLTSLLLSACNDATAPSNLPGEDFDARVAHTLITLAHYQEAYWADHLTYSRSLPEPDQWTSYYRGVAPPLGVEITILQADSIGWQAVATGTGIRDCRVFVGPDSHAIPGLREGIPSCWQPSTKDVEYVIDIVYEPLVTFVCTFPFDVAAADTSPGDQFR